MMLFFLKSFLGQHTAFALKGGQWGMLCFLVRCPQISRDSKELKEMMMVLGTQVPSSQQAFLAWPSWFTACLAQDWLTLKRVSSPHLLLRFCWPHRLLGREEDDHRCLQPQCQEALVILWTSGFQNHLHKTCNLYPRSTDSEPLRLELRLQHFLQGPQVLLVYGEK